MSRAAINMPRAAYGKFKPPVLVFFPRAAFNMSSAAINMPRAVSNTTAGGLNLKKPRAVSNYAITQAISISRARHIDCRVR